ncbi:MAG: SRPBCC family protein [Gammaproteobacteria bacterium]|nr:SRPBCC family protein [Gammaproteobacteria bacterium]
MTDKYAELIDDSTVRFERILPGSVELVWQYLVESVKRAKWLCAGDTELNVGGLAKMHFNNASLSTAADIEPPEKYSDMPDELLFSGHVTQCDPPRLLAHTWDFEEDHSEVCYQLEQVGDMTRLILTHQSLSSADEIISVCGGWHTHLAVLDAVLRDEEPPPFWKIHTPLEAEYKQRFGL